jgi:NADPH-dependent F420 reductase
VQAGDAPTGEIVVLAVWYPTSLELVREYSDQLDGKVIVDITNPIDTDAFEPLALDSGSAAQELDAAAPGGAKVVKAFNTTFAATLAPGEVSGTQLDVLIAGDDADAKGKVAELVESSGLRAIDAGPLRRARELEALGYLHMAIQDELGSGYGSTVKLIS